MKGKNLVLHKMEKPTDIIIMGTCMDEHNDFGITDDFSSLLQSL